MAKNAFKNEFFWMRIGDRWFQTNNIGVSYDKWYN